MKIIATCYNSPAQCNNTTADHKDNIKGNIDNFDSSKGKTGEFDSLVDLEVTH